MRKPPGRCGMLGAGGVFLLLVLWACGGGPESGNSVVLLSVHGERLSATLKQAPVGVVLAELARQTGIHVTVEGAAATETVSAEFANLPLEEGIKRIMQGKNYALAYGDEQHGKRGGSRIAAIRVLASGTSGAREGPTLLVSALRDADPQIRRAAVKDLGESGDESATGALGHLLTSDEDSKVRRAAAEALAEIGSPTALSALGRALQDQDRRVRRNTVEALAAIGGERALTLLQDAARDPHEELRRMAAEALLAPQEVDGE